MAHDVYGCNDAASLQVVDRSMKTPWFVAGLLVTGLSMLWEGARAGPLGGGFRGGFGGGQSRAFAGRGLRFPGSGRFFRHHRYGVVPVLGYDAFGWPWVYPPTDGYLPGYDYPGADYGAADVGPTSPALPAVVQSQPVQGGSNPVYIVINTGSALPAPSTGGVPGTAEGYRPATSVPQQTSRLPDPNDAPAAPTPDRPAPAPSPSPRRGAPAGIFDNLALVSWFNENGKDTILVEDTETKDVRQITSEPDKDNLRVVQVRPNLNPNLSEVVISNGTDQRAIRFHPEGGR
jgi:hypothetical protein